MTCRPALAALYDRNEKNMDTVLKRAFMHKSNFTITATVQVIR